jgi:hypothetical protein
MFGKIVGKDSGKIRYRTKNKKGDRHKQKSQCVKLNYNVEKMAEQKSREKSQKEKRDLWIQHIHYKTPSK